MSIQLHEVIKHKENLEIHSVAYLENRYGFSYGTPHGNPHMGIAGPRNRSGRSDNCLTTILESFGLYNCQVGQANA